MTNTDQIRALYEKWIESWNQKDATAMAALLSEECNMIGFDGSEMMGRDDVYKTIADIFSQYPTARFVSLIREVRFVLPTVAVLRAHVGMVPRGYSNINPNVNAIQLMTAVEHGGKWLISVFQNTPAAFHGRPELVEEMSRELQQEANKIGMS